MGVAEWDPAVVVVAPLGKTEMLVAVETDETLMRTGGMVAEEVEVGEESLREGERMVKVDVKVDVKEAVKEGAGNTKVGVETSREDAEGLEVAEARMLVEIVLRMWKMRVTSHLWDQEPERFFAGSVGPL